MVYMQITIYKIIFNVYATAYYSAFVYIPILLRITPASLYACVTAEQLAHAKYGSMQFKLSQQWQRYETTQKKTLSASLTKVPWVYNVAALCSLARVATFIAFLYFRVMSMHLMHKLLFAISHGTPSTLYFDIHHICCQMNYLMRRSFAMKMSKL